MKLKVKRSRKQSLPKILDNLKSLNRANTEVGFFDGEPHPDSDLDLASIATLLELGTVDGTQKARFPMEKVAIESSPDRAPEVYAAVSKYMRSLPRKDGSERLLDDIGTFYRDEYKNILGDASRLRSNEPSVIEKKGRDEPGIDTGYLHDNVGFRTSKNKQVRK